MKVFKNILFVILGVIATVAIFCVVIAIASSINGISFGTQITDWFGSIGNKTTELTNSVPKVLKSDLKALKLILVLFYKRKNYAKEKVKICK